MQRKAPAFGLFIAIVIDLVASILAWMAGCEGDTKGGTGNPVGALQIETWGVYAQFAALLIGSISVVLLPKSPTLRVPFLFAWIALAGPVLWVTCAFVIEGAAIRECFT